MKKRRCYPDPQWDLMDDETIIGWYLLAVIEKRWEDAREIAEVGEQRGMKNLGDSLDARFAQVKPGPRLVVRNIASNGKFSGAAHNRPGPAKRPRLIITKKATDERD